MSKQFLVVFVVFCVCYGFNDVMTGVAMWRAPQGPGWAGPSLVDSSYIPPKNSTVYSQVLPDVGFELLPYLDMDIATKPLILFMLVSFVRFIISENRSRIFMRFMLVDAILLLMRGLTVATTSLNNPYPPCYNCGSQCPDSVWGAIWMTVTKFPLFDCGDLMFSGHTVHFLLCALLWHRYTHNSTHKLFVWAYTLPGIFLLVVCRMHYTNDVLIGAFLTGLVWNWYTLVIDYYHVNPTNVDTTAYNPKSLLIRFIIWAECSIDDNAELSSCDPAENQHLFATTELPEYNVEMYDVECRFDHGSSRTHSNAVATHPSLLYPSLSNGSI